MYEYRSIKHKIFKTDYRFLKNFAKKALSAQIRSSGLHLLKKLQASTEVCELQAEK